MTRCAEAPGEVSGGDTRAEAVTIAAGIAFPHAAQAIQVTRRNGPHWVRDVTFGEDSSHIRTSAAPQVMAALRNLVISLHRLAGDTNIAAALRHHGRNTLRPLQLLKITD